VPAKDGNASEKIKINGPFWVRFNKFFKFYLNINYGRMMK
jgi:hypothetical protein